MLGVFIGIAGPPGSHLSLEGSLVLAGYLSQLFLLGSWFGLWCGSFPFLRGILLVDSILRLLNHFASLNVAQYLVIAVEDQRMHHLIYHLQRKGILTTGLTSYVQIAKRKQFRVNDLHTAAFELVDSVSLDKVRFDEGVAYPWQLYFSRRDTLVDETERAPVNNEGSFLKHILRKTASKVVEFRVHEKLNPPFLLLRVIDLLEVVFELLDFVYVLFGELALNLLAVAPLRLVHFDALVALLVDQAPSFHQHFRTLSTNVLHEHLQLDVLVLQVDIVLPKLVDLLSDGEHSRV